jgi:hypothetical protein
MLTAVDLPTMMAVVDPGHLAAFGEKHSLPGWASMSSEQREVLSDELMN